VDRILLGTSDLAKYPFLSEAKQRVAEVDLDFAELEFLKVIVDRAKQRITASLIFELRADKPSKKIDVEITSFPVAILMVSAVNDNTLTKRYALFEAKKIHNYLERERDDILFEIARFFKWKKVMKFKAKGFGPGVFSKKYKIHFIDYLNNATSSLVHDPSWKLANHPLEDGWLEITKREVCRLLQEEIREYIENRAAREVPRIPQIIQDMVDEVKTEYLKIKPHMTEFDKMRVFAEESEYPPCIQNLYDRMIKGQHLSHLERFTLVTYLLHQGINVNAIVTLFAGLSDYRQTQTRYQVEHLAGQRGSRTVYRPPNCATLRTHGVCVNPEDPICRTIKSPLTYHMRTPKRKKSVEEKKQ